MGNVFTAPHDMLKGLLRWHQATPPQCAVGDSACLYSFNNTGFDYTSHAIGVGVRYKTPIGPLRFDFGYNLNPTAYLQLVTGEPDLVPQSLRHFNVFFSIGQPF